MFFSCSGVQEGKTLGTAEIEQLKQLGLLDSGETIIHYYSQSKGKRDANFYTDRRIASYWKDRDTSKSQVNFAYYNQVASIDTLPFVGQTYSPLLKVKTKDSTVFKVYVDGKKNDVTAFFKGVVEKWNENK